MTAAQEPRLRIADAQLHPELLIASAPFGTWTGVVLAARRDDRIVLRVLRRSGEEELLTVSEESMDVVEAGLAQAGAPVEAGTGLWLAAIEFQPMLSRLDAADAFAAIVGMSPPEVEFVDDEDAHRAVDLRPAMLDGNPGWCGGVANAAAAPLDAG